MKTLEDNALLIPVKYGDEEARKVFVEEFVAEVQETFSKHFFPFKCLKAKTEPTVDIRLFGALFIHVDRGRICDEPEVETEPAFQEAVASILIPFEETMTTWQEGFHRQSLSSEVTPDGLAQIVQAITPTPTHLWAGSDFINLFFQSTGELAGRFRRAEKSLSVVEGLVGSFDVGDNELALYTDIFRYDTLRTLEPDEWFVVSENFPRKFWVEWGPIEHGEDESSCRVTLLGGMEE